MALSVFCRSAAAGPRAAAVLATLREVADEIVVAVDSRSDPAARADLVAVADRVLVSFQRRWLDPDGVAAGLRRAAGVPVARTREPEQLLASLRAEG